MTPTPARALALVAAFLLPVAARANTPQPKALPISPPGASAKDGKAPASAAAPTAQRPTAPAAPAPELDKIKFLAGTFACDASRPASDGAPEQHYKGRFAGKLDLGGFFVTFQYADLKAKDHPTVLQSSGFLGWDPGLRRFVFAAADSTGLSFLLRADVPPVDQYEFKGNATASFNRHVPTLYTVTRTMKGFDIAAEGADADGQMVKRSQMTCTKGGK
jgi:hypothetical protein